MRKTSGIWKFLHDSGVLDTGDDVLIKAKKAEYYRLYKKNWQISHRSKTTSVQYSLNAMQLRLVKTKYKAGQQPLSVFMRDAALAYCQTKFCYPTDSEVATIQEYLALLYDRVTALIENGIINRGDCDKFLIDFERIEQRYLQSLLHPSSLLNAVVIELQTNLSFKKSLEQLLNSSQ